MKTIKFTFSGSALSATFFAAALLGGSRLGAGTLPHWVCMSMKAEACCLLSAAALAFSLRRLHYETEFVVKI